LDVFKYLTLKRSVNNEFSAQLKKTPQNIFSSASLKQYSFRECVQESFVYAADEAISAGTVFEVLFSSRQMD
jgi:hypothetical protein